MNGSEDPTRTLQEIFDADFYPKLGVRQQDLAPVVEEFYDDVFPNLMEYTRQRPDAVASH